MDKGCQNEIEECVSNIAYENYEGSPINEPNYKVAKTYLLKLLNEYEDPGAANTLGYLHYYYDDSVDHFKKAFEYFKNKSQKEAYEVYYKTLYDIIKNYNNYSVVGHVDLIKRYGNYSNILKDSLFIDIIESILKEAIYKGKGIELNTSCFRYKLPDLTPSRKIISLYKDLGGEIITTGSDAHSPAFISCKFDYICSYLKDLGFKYISTFNNLKPNFIKL